MASKRFNSQWLPDDPNEWIDLLLRAASEREIDDERVKVLRFMLLDECREYLPVLMERISQLDDAQEAVGLTFLIQVLRDPRSIRPLRVLANDPETCPLAYQTAVASLRGLGVKVDVDESRRPRDDPAPALAILDHAIELLVDSEQPCVGEALAAMLSVDDEKLRAHLLLVIAERGGERVLARLAPLTQHPDARLARQVVRVLEQIPHPATLCVLQRVIDNPADLGVRREARRVLEALQAQGVHRTATDLELPSPATPWKIERAFLSNVDSLGSQMIHLLCAMVDGHCVTVVACLNERIGIKSCFGTKTTRRQFARDLRWVQGDPPEGILIAEADPDYCHWLLHLAAERNHQSHFPLTFSYQTWIAPLGPPRQQFDAPIIYRFVNPERIANAKRVLAASKDLPKTPEISRWMFPYEQVRPFAELGRSGALAHLDDPRQRFDLRELLDRAAVNLFSTEIRERIAHRLEENAYVFWQKGKRPRALQCVVVATKLCDESFPLRKIPFVRTMVQNSILVALGVLFDIVDPEQLNSDPWKPVN